MGNNQAMVPATSGTASPDHSIERVVSILSNLPARLDDQMLAMVEQISSLPLPMLSPCDDGHLVKCLRLMSVLPRKGDDDLTGEIRVKLFQRKLAHLPKEAVSYLADKAIDRCDWFPTIKEALAIAAEWQKPEIALKARALVAAKRERQTRFDETLKALVVGTIPDHEIAALSPRMLAIAETRSLVWLNPDGTFKARRADRLVAVHTSQSEIDSSLAAKWPTNREAA